MDLYSVIHITQEIQLNEGEGNGAIQMKRMRDRYQCRMSKSLVGNIFHWIVLLKIGIIQC